MTATFTVILPCDNPKANNEVPCDVEAPNNEALCRLYIINKSGVDQVVPTCDKLYHSQISEGL